MIIKYQVYLYNFLIIFFFKNNHLRSCSKIQAKIDQNNLSIKEDSRKLKYLSLQLN